MTVKGSKNSTAINKTLNSIVHQTEDVQKAVLAMSEVPEYTVVDISDEIETKQVPGQISGCHNEGEIFGDTNVGGIAGIMSMEVGDDPENDFNLQENLWIDTTALLRAVVMNSDNAGNIVVKNGYAGGVVGKGDVGAVYKSTNTGRIEATGDDKCGGIAGSSKGSVIESYAVCDLVGNDEVGGIVGEGTDIKKCYSMVRIDSGGEKLGAIAGTAAGDIEKNIFVLEDLRGIDRVNYEDKAWPLKYDEFIKLEGLPQIFKKLYVDFIIDGRSVKRIPISYGQSISEADVPNIPEKEDCYGQWEEFNRENIRRSIKVNAIYEKWITTLSSKEDIPIMLVQGHFSPNAEVVLDQWVYGDPVSNQYDVTGGYNYNVKDSTKSLPETMVFRLHCEEEDGDSIALYKDNKLTKIKTTRDGKYLVFNAPPNGKVLILKHKDFLKLILILVAVILIGGTIIYIIIRRNKKRRIQRQRRRRITQAPMDNTVQKQKIKSSTIEVCSEYTKYRGK
jgi:hypothetical protein